MNRDYRQSEVHTFLKCGKQWEFRHIKGIKTPPKAALTVGFAVDAGVNKNLSEKIKTGADLPLEAVLDTFSTCFDAQAKETEWGDDDAGKQKDMGARLMALHHEKAAPLIQPATVQETFHLKTDAGYGLTGTLDFTETSDVIGDTKTAKSAYQSDAVTKSLQAAMYDYAFEATRGRKAKGFRYDVLVKPTARKPAEFQQVFGEVTATDRSWLFDTINNMHRAIQAGVALPAADGSWWCSESWCGYWHICKGKK